MKYLWPIATLVLLAASPASAESPARIDLEQAVRNPARSTNFVARDKYRHPLEELRFAGVRPDATLIEIWPGGGYWSEILAPFLHAHGTYYTPVEAGPGWDKYSRTFRKKVAGNPAVFDRVKLTQMGVGYDDIAPPGAADIVFASRNFHNWMNIGDTAEMLADVRRALKPGGVFVIEDHRGRDTVAQDPKAEDGYVRQDYVIDTVTRAGFAFVASSEVLANPKDTKDWPQGVWTLPPTFILGDKDRARYAAIGEADNFLLKFRKPG